MGDHQVLRHKCVTMLRAALAVALLVFTLSGCAAIPARGFYRATVGSEEHYRGRVVDMDTGKPLEGVVVLGVYQQYVWDLNGGHEIFLCAKETVTDQNGEFMIPGEAQGPVNLGLQIFKAGYECRTLSDWRRLAEWGKKKDNKRFGWYIDRPLFRLKKLTMEERKRQGTPYLPAEPPLRDVRKFIMEINKDRTERGLDPLYDDEELQ